MVFLMESRSHFQVLPVTIFIQPENNQIISHSSITIYVNLRVGVNLPCLIMHRQCAPR